LVTAVLAVMGELMNDNNWNPLVLVVDDDPLIRDLERMLLQYAGYRVAEASAGEQALEVAARDRPQAIVLDVALPTISGLEVVDKLAADADTSSIPVVVVSGYARFIERQKRSQIVASVDKPFDTSTFVRTVGEVISR
jgi:CheY-like chemotaxis protein